MGSCSDSGPGFDSDNLEIEQIDHGADLLVRHALVTLDKRLLVLQTHRDALHSGDLGQSLLDRP